MKKVLGIGIVIALVVIGVAYAVFSTEPSSENLAVPELEIQEEPKGKSLTIDVNDGVFARGVP